MRYINDIIIHSTATPEGRSVSVDEIRQWYKARGFADIGYHYVVYLDGSVHNGRAISRPGAHCKGHNAHSIGIVYVGGCDKNLQPKDTRTIQQKASLYKLIKNLVNMYRCKVHSCRDYSATSNPSFDATREYAKIYNEDVLQLNT